MTELLKMLHLQRKVTKIFGS